MKTQKQQTKRTSSSTKKMTSKTYASKISASKSNQITCNKQWLNSKTVRPKTVVIVAERSQNGYKVKSATVRLAINQYSKTAVPITDLGQFVKDINTKGIRLG